jgi:hypothetical protein
VLPERERLTQLARLIGLDRFRARFGPPDSAAPTATALHAFVEEHVESIARGLVEEAAASDDVTDQASALAYLDDRLRTLDDLLTPDQVDRIRAAFRARIAHW